MQTCYSELSKGFFKKTQKKDEEKTQKVERERAMKELGMKREDKRSN